MPAPRPPGFRRRAVELARPRRSRSPGPLGTWDRRHHACTTGWPGPASTRAGPRARCGTGVSRLNQARLTIVSTSWVESEVRGRDAERQVALDPARVPQAKLVADERSPVVGGQVDAVEPGRRPGGRSTAAASGLRHCTCRGRGQPDTAAVGGQICNAGCTGCPGRHQPGPNRQRCRRKAGASWRPSWGTRGRRAQHHRRWHRQPGTRWHRQPGTALPCPAGFAGPGPAWQRPGKEEL